MNSIQYMEQAERDLLHTYNRYGVILKSGAGVYLTDTDGKQYLDFAAGIGVCALGYGNQEYNQALKDQIDELIHTSNLYYNLPVIKAAEQLKKVSGMDRVFFTNSGTEAIEGAIKAAKKYAYTKDGHVGHEIIAMNNSFHGRSLGALSVTGNKHYQEAFEPLLEGIRFAEFNRLDTVKELVNGKTCAILLETIQGEGGIYPAQTDFLEGIAEICKENDILLILDEIQCGMGRSGKMFAWQNYSVQPDIMTAAKALGCGVPVGAFFMTERVAEKSLVPGDHITEHVKKVSDYLWERLEKLKEKHTSILDHRGIGLMQGLQMSLPVGEVSKNVLKEGLILITAGSNVLRFLPPLIIAERHVDEMAAMLDRILDEMER